MQDLIFDMRGTGTITLGLLALSNFVLAQPSPPAIRIPRAGPLNQAVSTVFAVTSRASTTVTASILTPPESAQPLTTTNTIEVSSFIPSALLGFDASSFAASTSSSFRSTSSPTLSSTIDNSTAIMGSEASNEGVGKDHRTLIIVLSTVLGCFGLLLIAGSLFLISRYRRRKSPFLHRGASPIDDDEIASWRQNVDQKPHRAPPPAHLVPKTPECSVIVGGPPTWTWTASPTSPQTAWTGSPNSVQTMLSPSSQFPDSPSFLAKAPNSRAGLTDETIPGADPYVAPMKRQGSRLSKAPPGHMRTKSGRSSFSARSVASYQWQHRTRQSSDSKGDGDFKWFDPEDDSVASRLRVDRTSSSVGTSLFDGLSMGGGLSPRPPTRNTDTDRGIGRAIG